MTQFKSVAIRFLKGGIASAIVSMGLVTIQQPKVWTEFIPLLNSLAMAGAFGAVVGILLAAEKWANWTDTPPTQ